MSAHTLIPRAFFLSLATAALWVGCSDVEFKAKPPEVCQGYNQGSCVVTPDNTILFTGTQKTGKVDILFVNDNSYSMYPQQNQMANRFSNFVSGISKLDFQIAMITTDVSASPNNSIPRAANGNGAFQDGKFLGFPNGTDILTSAMGLSAVDSHFRATVRRSETLNCDPIAGTCPSSDERGIYALNQAFDRADSRFFRVGSHLAVVILSDEDERGKSGTTPGYPLEAYDLPETLVQKLGTAFGPTKTMSVHSIIVQPGDTNCYNLQREGTSVFGQYGYLYSELSFPSANLKSSGKIVDGSIGTICASDYGSQLSGIAAAIEDNTQVIQLMCAPLEDNGVTTLNVSFSPAQNISYSVNSQNQLVFNSNVPAGTTINYTYKCNR